MTKKISKKCGNGKGEQTDARFANLHSDPRFKPIKKSKFKADERFQSLYQRDFSFYQEKKKGKLDKYGRPVSAHLPKKKNRWETAFENIENKDEEQSDDSISDISFGEDLPTLASMEMKKAQGHAEESDDDTLFDTVLDKKQIPLGQPTARLAVLNMDWDHLEPVHLLKLMDSIKPPGGHILSVKQYRSEFGKERLKYEETHGPKFETPALLSSTSNVTYENGNASDCHIDDEEADDIGVGSGDEQQLRRYELEKLRYYYMIVTCDSVATAEAIFRECDGVEFEMSSNVLDLRYVPVDTDFNDDPVKEATQVPVEYVPLQFQTNVFQHTQVKSTWDDDRERPLLTKRITSQAELDIMDYEAYIASSSDSEQETKDKDTDRIQKYRALLGLAPERAKETKGDPDEDDNASDDLAGREEAEKEEVTGDMEITFSLDLSETARSLLEERENKVKREKETTLETYQRKMKERKLRKLERREDASVSEEMDVLGLEGSLDENIDEEDPFFSTSQLLTSTPGDYASPPQKNKRPKHLKEKKKKKHGTSETLADSLENQGKHASMAVDLQDPRFHSLLEDHEYAIDPNHPQFKDSKYMQHILHSKRNSQQPRAHKGTTKEYVDLSNVLELAQTVKNKSSLFLKSMEQGIGRRKREL